jgi:hypothetical protein
VIHDERAKSTSVAHGYNEWKDLGTWRDWQDGWRSGSGDVISSLIDVWKWQRALVTGKLIAPAQTKQMFTAQVKSDENGGYGYGWFTTHTARGDSLIYHGGDNPGYHTECRWYPQRDLTIMVFTDLELYDESGSGLGLHKRIIASALERIDRGETIPLPPPPTQQGANEAYLSEFTATSPMQGVTIETGYPMLRFAADSQAAINRVLGLKDERLDDDNKKVETLLNAVAKKDSVAVRKTLGKGADFFLGFAFKERDDMEKQYGKFKSMRLYGTKPDLRAQNHRLPVHVEERRILRDHFRYRRAARAHAAHAARGARPVRGLGYRRSSRRPAPLRP